MGPKTTNPTGMRDGRREVPGAENVHDSSNRRKRRWPQDTPAVRASFPTITGW